MRAGEPPGIATRLSDIEIEIPTNTSLGQAFHEQGDYRQAAALFRRNIEMLVGELAFQLFRGAAPRSIHSRTCMVSSLAELGEFDEAAARVDETIRSARALEHPYALVVASAGLGHLLLRRGEGRARSRSSGPRSRSRAGPTPPCGFRAPRPRWGRPTSWPTGPG